MFIASLKAIAQEMTTYEGRHHQSTIVIRLSGLYALTPSFG
jgi:hypothetical protein